MRGIIKNNLSLRILSSFLCFVLIFNLCIFGFTYKVKAVTDTGDPNREITITDIPDSILYNKLKSLADTNRDGKLIAYEIENYPGDFTGTLDLSNLGITNLTGIDLVKNVKTINLAGNNGITVIPDSAFSKSLYLNTVVIPESVTSVGDSAFDGCLSLSNINLPANLSSIGIKSFNGCLSLTNITLPAGISKIGDSAFAGSGLTTITIPNSYVAMGVSIFNGCYNLTSAFLPEGIKSIPMETFKSTGLTNITIPKSVITIEEGAFNGSLLKYIDLSQNTNLISIKLSAFSGTPINSAKLPESLTELGARAFENCINLPSINIPEKIAVINDLTFSKNTSLKSITFTPGKNAAGENVYNLREIGYAAFNGCYSLGDAYGIVSDFDILSNLTTIGPEAFANCSNPQVNKDQYGDLIYNGMREIRLPANITTIGQGAFSGCMNLRSFSLPPKVTVVDDNTFKNDVNLKSISLSSILTKIGNYSFANCNVLSQINLPSSLQSIGDFAFTNCADRKETVTINNGVNQYSYTNTGLTGLILPDSITSIGIGAFKGDFVLHSITLPSTLTALNESTFEGCSIQDKDYLGALIPNSFSGLQTITYNGNPDTSVNALPNSITTIGLAAFKDCKSIPDILLPHGLKSIGVKAFYGCEGLQSVSFRWTEYLETIGESAFENCNNLMIINIEYAVSLTKISAKAFRNCLIAGLLKIPAKVTTIEDNVFENNPFITSVEFPDGLLSIGKLSFKDCSSLTSINLPAATTIVYEGYYTSFDNCSSLTNAIVKPVPQSISAYENAETVLPVKCFNEIISVESGNENVSTVRVAQDALSKPQVILKGISQGTTQITIKGSIEYEAGKDAVTGYPLIRKFDTMVVFDVSVTTIKCTSVAFDKPVVGLSIAKTSGVTLTPVITPANTTDIKTWSSDNEGVVRVDSNGTVYPVSYGTATVRLKVGSLPEAVCQVNVCAPTSFITLSKPSTTLIEGSSDALTVTPYYSSTYNDFKTAYPDVITWSSSNTAVATVDSNGNIKGISPGEAKITARAEASGATSACTVTVVPENTIVTFDKTTLNLTKGGSGKIYITVNPVSSPLSKIIVKSSSYAASTSVSGNIITVVGNSGGTAKITATPVSGVAAECVVNIISPYTSLTAKPMTLNKGYSKTIELVKTPFDATEKLIYTSRNTGIATVDSSGKVTGISSGTTLIDIVSESGAVKTTCEVTVYTPVTGVSLSASTGTISIGGTMQLTATVKPADATDKGIVWSSSNSSVAIVSSSGKVTGVAKGSASITARSATTQYYYASCFVTVGDTAPVAIKSIRLGGTTRFDTAVKVSQACFTTSDSVVIVNAYGFADALTGVSFAYLKDTPILLTDAKSLNQSTLNEIIRLKAKTAYILGGTGVVSTYVENLLRNRGMQVNRISGTDRFKTALAIANQVELMKPGNTAIVTTAYNYPDALAMSPYAAMNGYPVLYTGKYTLDAGTKGFLTTKGIKKVIIPGGTGVVSSDVENQLKYMGITVERVFGTDRYSTASNIAFKYASSFDRDVILTTGTNFPDALAGGVLAAKKRIPILLVSKTSASTAVKTYIKSKASLNIYVLGGTGVVSDTVVNSVKY